MSPRTFVQLVEKHVSKKGGQAVMTTAEKLIEQGEIKGKIEGEIKGKIEGEKEGLLKILKWTAPELVMKYEIDIRAAKTEQDLQALEEKIRQDIEDKKDA